MKKWNKKLLTCLLIMIIVVGTLATPVFANSPSEDSVIAIADEKAEAFAGLPAGQVVVVDGQIAYIPTLSELKASEAVYAQRVAATPGLPRTADAPRAYGLISYTCSTQEQTYYCGPATAQQVIRCWTGTTYAQSSLATSIGTTTGGSTFVNTNPGTKSVEHTIESYAGVAYEVVWSPSEQQVKDCAYYGVFTSGLPTCIMLLGSTSYGFPYNSDLHIVSTSGYDDSTGTAKIRIADPHYDHSGHRWHTAAQISDAIDATVAKVLIY